ncbi:chromate transporter, chromate ion transporter (CHR) family [Alkaliphilus metalliredigens QYMF]|uniref:Chromate transporter, chromate ion transporter (CHR) family n=1 Tax=Alkaliphilus metalliredigens (strain QYMF) TaxID=293826 RepID=A6TNK0_ALKMQ|nr:chromate efflux transporter [Alkaliphilus metalliredigens]ABR47768.1 chromate transporter, chromate ion transporter (CHR) family [Alkaliphilus metalliredigens QYMF]
MNKEINLESERKLTRGTFLKDVFICSLGAYGGPEAHYGVFTEQMVVKKKYLNEEELVELIALCSILPGPSSTQTIVAIGHKTGGPLLAFLTMLVWALPVLTVMTLLSFVYQFLDSINVAQDGLRYIGPMAVGFIIVAAYRIGRKVVTDNMTLLLLLLGGVTTYFIRAPWIFPLVLILGGIVSIMTSKEKDLWNRVKLNPPWPYLIAFGVITVGAILLAFVLDNRIIHLFESFYRYGYLVFGGGQVVVPVMHSELVEVNRFMTNQEFLTGYGLVQGLPGPMFSFSAYAGGLAARGGSAFTQVLGSIVGGIGIFLPGLLLIYFIYPIWENLKKIKGIKVSLKGINAVAGGLIAVAAVILMQNSGFMIDNIVVTLLTVGLLLTKKIPAPLIVLVVLIAGFTM